MKLELIAATTFGLEAPVKRELIALGYKILKSEDGKITFLGDERAIVRANLWLRCSDRVQIKMAEFKALEFEDLFQQVKAAAWEEWIPSGWKIHSKRLVSQIETFQRAGLPVGGGESGDRETKGNLCHRPL